MLSPGNPHRVRAALVCGACIALAARAQTPGSGQTGAALQQIAAAGRIDDLRWPDFSNYRAHVKNFYESGG